MLHSDIWNTHDSRNISVHIPAVLSMHRFFSVFFPTWKVHADICWRADNIGGKGLQGVTDLPDSKMMEIRCFGWFSLFGICISFSNTKKHSNISFGNLIFKGKFHDSMYVYFSSGFHMPGYGEPWLSAKFSRSGTKRHGSMGLKQGFHLMICTHFTDLKKNMYLHISTTNKL